MRDDPRKSIKDFPKRISDETLDGLIDWCRYHAFCTDKTTIALPAWYEKLLALEELKGRREKNRGV